MSNRRPSRNQHGFWVAPGSRMTAAKVESAAHTREVDTSEFYQPPPLPKGFDPATSVSGAQIAKLMTVALESDYWCDLEPVLPGRFKSLMTNPVWYADPALYETQQPWYFEIPNREYGYYAAKIEAPHKDVVHKIGRADIIMALASLAENRPRRIVEINFEPP
jgi:hypothetical protein